MTLPTGRGRGGRVHWRGPWDAWSPLEEFESLWSEMGRLFERLPMASPVAQGGAWMPLAEEDESDDACTVRVELPGVPRDKVQVEIDDQELTVSGAIDEQRTTSRALSRRTGRFSYRTSLPSGVIADQAEAELTDGVLTVRIPKKGRPARHRLAVGGQDLPAPTGIPPATTAPEASGEALGQEPMDERADFAGEPLEYDTGTDIGLNQGEGSAAAGAAGGAQSMPSETGWTAAPEEPEAGENT